MTRAYRIFMSIRDELEQLEPSRVEALIHEKAHGERDVIEEVRRLFESHPDLHPTDSRSRSNATESIPARTVRWQCDACDRTFVVSADAEREACPYCGDVNRPRLAGTELTRDDVWQGFRIRKVLDKGGQGVVYHADEIDQGGRSVALKVRRPDHESELMDRRFRRECDLVRRLDGRHFARIFRAGFGARGEPFIAMEYLGGGSIVEYAKEESLNLDERLQLFARACDAIGEAHARGVVHCDLKPSNILMSDLGPGAEPRIIDFGAAELLEPTRFGLEDDVPLARVYTTRYASPEQMARPRRRLTTSSDVYSLGLVLSELLLGTAPRGDLEDSADRDLLVRIHDRLGDHAQARVLKRSGLRRRSSLRRRLGGDLGHIVAKALRADPEDRYGDAAELARDVRRLLANQHVDAAPRTLRIRFGRMARGRSRLLVLIALVTAIFAATILSDLLLGGSGGAVPELDERLRRIEAALERIESGLDTVRPVGVGDSDPDPRPTQ